jgi:hypothetical protein
MGSEIAVRACLKSHLRPAILFFHGGTTDKTLFVGQIAACYRTWRWRVKLSWSHRIEKRNDNYPKIK